VNPLNNPANAKLYPVIKDQHGNILDGFHRKRANPNWKETTIEVKDLLHALRIRVHANIMRMPEEDRQLEIRDWIAKVRSILQERGFKGTQKEIAEALGMSQQWVSLYDPITHQEHPKVPRLGTFYQMKKIVIPEGSLLVELDEESFWRLVAAAEEKIAFESKDSIYYFNSSEVIFYFLKTNSGCEVKF